MIVVGLVAKLLVRLIVGIIGKKLSLALVVLFLGMRALRATGAWRSLKRGHAWLMAARGGPRLRPRT